MAVFNDFLTIEGERLLARSLAGEVQITFTRVEIGDGDQAIVNKNITALSNKRMDLDIYSVSRSGNVITISSILDSQLIEEGFYFREKGLYATDGTTEVLMIYANCGSLADWIENINYSVFTRQIRSIITFSESDNISITLQDGLYASTSDIADLGEQVQGMINNIKLEGDWSTYSQVDGFITLFTQFLGWYTQTRAGKLDKLDKLDNVDATISSRAPASTALSTATWTAARAGYLDYLANGTYGLQAIKNYVDTLETVIGTSGNTGGTASTGTAMAKLNILIQMLTNQSVIASTVKRVVRGVVTTYGSNVTISIGYTVNVNKVVIILNPSRTSGYSSSPQTQTPYVVSVTSTTFEISPNCMQNHADDGLYVGWQLIEYY